MRQREKRFEGRDPGTAGADERLRQLLTKDRDALRGEHDPETSRRRLMGLLAASAMPADGGGIVGTTSSWTAKLASGKIFLNSVLALLLSGGVTFLLLDSSEGDRTESSIVPRTETVREHPSGEPVLSLPKTSPVRESGETVGEQAKESRRTEAGPAERRLPTDAHLPLPVPRADAGPDADPKEQVQTSPTETPRVTTRRLDRLQLQMKVDSVRKE